MLSNSRNMCCKIAGVGQIPKCRFVRTYVSQVRTFAPLAGVTTVLPIVPQILRSDPDPGEAPYWFGVGWEAYFRVIMHMKGGKNILKGGEKEGTCPQTLHRVLSYLPPQENHIPPLPPPLFSREAPPHSASHITDSSSPGISRGGGIHKGSPPSFLPFPPPPPFPIHLIPLLLLFSSFPPFQV